MKKASIILFILFPFIVFAQGVPKDPKAMALLDEATSVFDSKKGIIADFTITVENTRDDLSEELAGKIWLKGEKFKLSIKDIETYFDGKTQSVYMKDVKEVTISSPDAGEMAEINPVMLIKSYRNGYKMKYLEETQNKGVTIEVIDLYPEDLRNDNARITISVEKESMRLHSVRMQGKGGINTILTMQKYDYSGIPDSFFSFDPTAIKDIEIIDLR